MFDIFGMSNKSMFDIIYVKRGEVEDYVLVT